MSDLKTIANIPTSTENWCYTSSKKFECEFIWIIPDFNLHMPGLDSHNKLKSTTFSATNDHCEWFFELLIKNICEDEDYESYYSKWLYLDLKMVQSKAANFIPISGNVTVSLLDSGNVKSNQREKHFFLKHETGTIEMEFLRLSQSTGSSPSVDELRIHCKLSYIREITNLSKHSLIEMDDDNPMDDFERLFNNEESSDVIIDVNGKRYPAHKTILAARSPVFKAMFEHEMIENLHNCVEIKNTDEEIFLEVLRYIYTGKVENFRDTALELLPIAEKYDLAKLKKMCSKVLATILTEDNVVKILILADMNNASYLKTQATKYIRANVLKAMRSKYWNELNAYPDLMKDILDVEC